MGKHIQLAIDNPCHESWENMTEADKGRFCASCQKQVIDFTRMTDSQVAAFFKKPSTGSVCGRFFEDQLERDMEIPRKRIPWVKYFFQIAIPAFLVSMKATAQGRVKIKTTVQANPVSLCSKLITKEKFIGTKPLVGDTIYQVVPGRIGLKSFSIKGVVVDEENSPVLFASVIVKGMKIGTMADSLGMFQLKGTSIDAGVLLEISSVGRKTTEAYVNNETSEENITVRLETLSMGEVVVPSRENSMSTIRLGGAIACVKITKRSKNIATITTPTEAPSMIKVYPNPVVSGTSINIGCQQLKEGYYLIQLTNVAGQPVLSKETWIDGEMQVLNLDIPAVAPGIYFLKLTSRDTKKRLTQKILIEH